MKKTEQPAARTLRDRQRPVAHLGKAVTLEMEVPFYDVDGLGVVWHGNYLKYFDVCRTELMRAHDLDVGGLSALKYRMMVIEARCRYVYPLRYAERFSVTGYFTEIQNRIRIGFLAWNLTHDRRTAKAYTTLVTIDGDGTMLWETPKSIRDRIVG